MWQQDYPPIFDNRSWSTPLAALPLLILLYLRGIRRRPAWVAALSGLGAAALMTTLRGWPLGSGLECRLPVAEPQLQE